MKFIVIKDVLLLLLVSLVPSYCDPHNDIKDKVRSAMSVTMKTMDTLFDRWKVKKYPVFLRAATMSHMSYEVLKTKYQMKILQSLASADKANVPKMVISFLGSSVTAGHDTEFNITVSELTRYYMKSSFEAIGIDFRVINGALGNNPCTPYDICVKAFAGPDADIIQWEQVNYIT